MKRKTFRNAVSPVDPETRSMRVSASAYEKDLVGEIVAPWMFRKQLADPEFSVPFQASHLYYSEDGKPTTIGRAEGWVAEPKRLVSGKTWFAEDAHTTGLAEAHLNLYEQRAMSDVSIGFRADDAILLKGSNEERAEAITKATKDATGAEGPLPEGYEQAQILYTEGSLLELSAVAIGANRGAFVLAAMKGNNVAERIVKAMDEQKLTRGDLEEMLLAFEERFAKSMGEHREEIVRLRRTIDDFQTIAETVQPPVIVDAQDLDGVDPHWGRDHVDGYRKGFADALARLNK